MSSNFIVFPFGAVSGLFCSSLKRQRTNTPERSKGQNGGRGGWQGASGGAVRDKHALSFGATPAHQPERSSEPRLSGVHPKEGGVGRKAWPARGLRKENEENTK